MLVLWSENAKSNLKDYIENSNIITQGEAQQYVTSLIDYVDNLQNFYGLGKFLFIKDGFEFRQLIYHIHRIFYAINNNTVHILLVTPTTRDMKNIIKYLKSKKILL